jgi:hypothetical protein
MAVFLHRSGSAEPVPARATADTCIAGYRRELERQRRLLRDVWLWYIAPFLPGLAIFLIGAVQVKGGASRVGPGFLLLLAILAGVCFLIAGLNYLESRRLKREIDSLPESSL